MKTNKIKRTQQDFNVNSFWLQAKDTRRPDLAERREDLRWSGILSFLHYTGRIKLRTVVVQTLKSHFTQKESNYFSFYHIIRLFSLIHTQVITNDVTQEGRILALEAFFELFFAWAVNL